MVEIKSFEYIVVVLFAVIGGTSGIVCLWLRLQDLHRDLKIKEKFKEDQDKHSKHLKVVKEVRTTIQESLLQKERHILERDVSDAIKLEKMHELLIHIR